jgi:hypothetical protein
MNRTIPRVVRTGFVALAVLAASGLFARPSMASCSHYVVANAGRTGFDILNDLDILSAARHEGDTKPLPQPPQPSPCAGLSCSKSPLLPSVPASVKPRAEQWGYLAGLIDARAASPFGQVAEPPSGRPVHTGSRLDRPPRVA